MYFFDKKTPSGKVLQLLESYRDIRGRARNRIVVSLGNIPIPEEHRKLVSASVEAKLYGQLELIPHGPEIDLWVDQIVKRIERENRWTPLDKCTATFDEHNLADSEIVDGVLVDQIDHTHNTTLGPELVGLHAWNALKMNDVLASLGFNEAQRQAASVSVINRLVEPVSEHALPAWLPTSSLPDLLSEDILQSFHRYYRVSDKLLECQDTIERHLQNMVACHFGFRRTIILYDLTNTHFEGVCEANPKARRGKNKQKRNDCPQVVVAVCFDEYGFVLFHKTYSGSTKDNTTLVEMIDDMQRQRDASELSDSNAKPLVIMDAGIATKENLNYLRRNQYGYLVNDSRRSRGRYHQEFNDIDQFSALPGRTGKSAVAIRVLDEDLPPEKVTDDQNETVPLKEKIVLCRSDQRGEKETSIISNVEQKLLDDLQSLSRRIERGRLKDPSKIERAIGRILGKHTRVAKYYKVDVKVDKKTETIKLLWNRRDEPYEQAEDLSGCYVLRSNQVDLNGEELWHLYMTLTQAEAGFKALKSELGLRPNFHQIEERVDAHIFITILAYQLQRFITYTLSGKGDHRCWTTLRRVLQTHCYATLLVPTVHHRLYRIRKAGTPEECQRYIYRLLGIDTRTLPKTKIVVNRNSRKT